MSEAIGDLIKKVFSQKQSELGGIDVFCMGEAGGNSRFVAYFDSLNTERQSGALQLATGLVLTYYGDLDDDLHAQLTDPILGQFHSAGAPEFNFLPNMQAESLISSIKQLDKGTILVVADAGRLRFSNVTRYTNAGAGGDDAIGLPEDVWVPHLIELIARTSPIAKERELYVLLDVGYSRPHREALINEFETADANIVWSFIMDDQHAEIQHSIATWPQWMEKGELKQVFDSIEKLPGVGTSARTLLRAQVLVRVGLLGHAIEEIQKVEAGECKSPDVLAQLAQVAIDCGASILARNFLSLSVPGLSTREALEAALSVAQHTSDSTLESEIVHRLARNFPASSQLVRSRIRSSCLARDYAAAAEAAKLLTDGRVEEDAYIFIAQCLAVSDVPDYSDINRQIEARGAAWSMLAREAIVRDALARGLIIHALNVLEQFPIKVRVTRKGTILSLDTLLQVLMARAPKCNDWIVDTNRLQAILWIIIQYVSATPSDVHVHGRLVHLLSVEGGGSFGTPAMLAQIAKELRIKGWRTRITELDEPMSSVQVQSAEPILMQALDWMEQHSPTVFGRTRLPEHFLLGNPSQFVSTIRGFLSHFEGNVKDDGDLVAIENWLALGIAAAPHLPNTLQDLRLTNVAAVLLAQNGRQQRARDFAQQILLSAGTDPQRRRLAWSATLSIQKACGAHVEALISLACAMAIDVAVDPQDGWQEANDLTKIFRDAGLYDLAIICWEMAGSLLESIDAKKRMRVQHTSLGLSIRMKDVAHRAPHSRLELGPLLSDATDLAELVLQGNHSRKPVVVMLGQLINLAVTLKMPVAPETGATFQRLMADRGAKDPVVDAATVSMPTAEQLLAVHLKPERARFAADVANEVRNATIMAGRFISNSVSLADATHAMFAIELLADRAIAAPGWVATPAPVHALEAIDTAAEIAISASLSGASVLMIAMDRTQVLVRVDCEKGEITPAQRVPSSTFSGAALDEWKKKYPYAYADEKIANVFFLSTEALRFFALPASPILVVASTNLQCLPLHLWRLGEEFAGNNHALVAVPSLSWLRAARAVKLVDGRKKFAWLSTNSQVGQTIGMVANRLDETFKNHGVELNTNSALPTSFTGQKLVVVTAHGGTAPGGKDYFARISDEGGLSVNGEEFARSLRNVDVVVLFVCSGGRSDKNPTSETTAGMVKQLLDAGCSAVIASPWPLDPRVAYHWLPTFMDAWRDGADLAQANLQANRNVDQNFPWDFAKSLAMHCFGNPFIRYQ